MPCRNFIDVRLLVNGLPLEEYADPDGDFTVRYVGAIAGQSFSVQVKWLRGFALKYAPHLYYQFRIDDDNSTFYFEDRETRRLSHRKGFLTQEVAHAHGGKCVKAEDGQWCAANFTFGALGIDDSHPCEFPLTNDELSNLGRIKVEVYRAKKVPRKVPYFNTGKVPQVQDSVPEKLMKGRLVKNNTKYVVNTGQAESAPAGVFDDFVPVDGFPGTIEIFEFKYRNKKILQHLECIPRSPSPPPDYALIAARTEEMLKDQKEKQRKQTLEVLRLRQENERLRGSTSRGSSTTLLGEDHTYRTAIPHIKSEGSSQGLKREREDDDLTELMPPPKRPVPTIELEDNSVLDASAPRGQKRARDDGDDDEELREMAPPTKRPLIFVDLTDDD